MQIDYLSLVNFRNYAQAEFNFKPGFNLLLGKNGQGKTNAVESIIFLANQTSHRTNSQRALIKSGETEAIIRAKLFNSGREALIETKIVERGSNKYFLNKRSVTGRQIQQILQAVIFAPEDLQIVRGEPSNRRSFIDQILTSRYPTAIAVLSDYEKTIRHKSALLKNIRAGRGKDDGENTLSLWNDKIIDLGSQIIYYRQQVINDLNPLIADSYRKISGGEAEPHVSVKSTLDDVSRETLQENVTRSTVDVSRETIMRLLGDGLLRQANEEREKTQCLVGPHRDDLLFDLNKLPVKGYASHGETWSFVLALKLAVARLLAQESNYGDPIIILDDVFAELDRGRQQRLISEIASFQQVIVTAAVADDVPEGVNKNIFKIKNGEVL